MRDEEITERLQAAVVENQRLQRCLDDAAETIGQQRAALAKAEALIVAQRQVLELQSATMELVGQRNAELQQQLRGGQQEITKVVA